jgi:hypothetical protein
VTAGTCTLCGEEHRTKYRQCWACRKKRKKCRHCKRTVARAGSGFCSDTCAAAEKATPMKGMCGKCRKPREADRLGRGRFGLCLSCSRLCTKCERPRKPGPRALCAEHLFERQTLKKYGLTYERWEAMLIAQNRARGICKSTHKRLVVDHDHETGAVRGLLCDDCNTTPGSVGDSRDAVRSFVSRVLAYFEGASR